MHRAAYQQQVLLPGVKARLAVEAGVAQGWERWVGQHGRIISMERFGASAPVKVLFEKFGFTVSTVVEQARQLLQEVGNPMPGQE
jgi:transketolase